MNASRTQKGHSLVETLAAMALLGIGLTTLARATADAAAGVERAGRATEALALAIAVAESLRSRPGPDPSLAVGGAVDAATSSGASSWFLDVGRLQARWRVARAGPEGDLLRVEIAVVGPSRGAPVTLLSRLVLVRPGW